MRKWVYILSLALLTACSGGNDVSIPDDVLTEDEMVALLTDMKILEGAVQKRVILHKTHQEDIEAQTAAIFEKHNVTKEKFERSFDFYEANPQIMHGIYEQVLEELSKMQADAKGRFQEEQKKN